MANRFSKGDLHVAAALVIKYMMQIWPERVIARGEIILEPYVADEELKTS
jgi:hypothetical protein